MLLNATVGAFHAKIDGEVERWFVLGSMSVESMQQNVDRLERMSEMFKRRGIILPAFETLGLGVLALYVGILSNPDAIINKIPLEKLKSFIKF